MVEPLVSVIIPVYKAEQFLDECLKSVIGQDYPVIEIILVDDGSPDSCPEMCDCYAEAYDNIRVLHKTNDGPGPARNAGLEMISGKYVIFVDADDRLDGVGAIRRMVEQAEKNKADIVVGSFRRFCGQHISGVNHHRLQDGVYTEAVDFRFKGFVLYNHLSFSWGKLYRRTFLTDNNIKFRDYPFSEDKSFNMMCCTCKPVYTFVDESVYLYGINGDSITSRYHDNYISVWIAIASDFELYLSERGIVEEYFDLLAFHLCFGLFFLTQQELMCKGMSETVKALSSYGKNPLVRRIVKELARGRYIGQIELKAWRLMIWGASLLCSFQAYFLLVLGIWVLQKSKVDKRFVSSKYES